MTLPSARAAKPARPWLAAMSTVSCRCDEVDPERPGPLQGFDLIVRRGPDGGVRQEQHPEPSGAVEIGRGEAETVAAVRTLAQSALDGEALKRVAGRKGRRPDEVDAVELAA